MHRPLPPVSTLQVISIIQRGTKGCAFADCLEKQLEYQQLPEYTTPEYKDTIYGECHASGLTLLRGTVNHKFQVCSMMPALTSLHNYTVALCLRSWIPMSYVLHPTILADPGTLCFLPGDRDCSQAVCHRRGNQSRPNSKPVLCQHDGTAHDRAPLAELRLSCLMEESHEAVKELLHCALIVQFGRDVVIPINTIINSGFSSCPICPYIPFMFITKSSKIDTLCRLGDLVGQINALL